MSRASSWPEMIPISMPESFRRLAQDALRVLHLPQGVGAHRPDLFRRNRPEPFPEPREGVERLRQGLLGQRLVVSKPGGEPDPFPQAVDVLDLVLHHADDLHVEAVRAQVDGSKNIREFRIRHRTLS